MVAGLLLLPQSVATLPQRGQAHNFSPGHNNILLNCTATWLCRVVSQENPNAVKLINLILVGNRFYPLQAN